MLVQPASFWPLFKTSEHRCFGYTDKTGQLPPVLSVFSYDPITDSMLCKDYDEKNNWKDTWYLQYKPGLGLAEWRDDYPQSGWISKLFGPIKKEVFSEPILWGNTVSIGQTITNKPRVDPFKSTPPQILFGKQEVVFEAILEKYTTDDGSEYSTVLQFRYAQSWGLGNAIGARYWMALGVGPIAISWIGYGPKGETVYTSPVLSATVKSMV